MELGVLRVLLVRHGLSEDNLNAIWAGHRDSPLTSVGVSQAKALGATLANYSFHAIYTSDLKRASSTAEEILAVRAARTGSLTAHSHTYSLSRAHLARPTALYRLRRSYRRNRYASKTLAKPKVGTGTIPSSRRSRKEKERELNVFPTARIWKM